MSWNAEDYGHKITGHGIYKKCSKCGKLSIVIARNWKAGQRCEKE